MVCQIVSSGFNFSVQESNANKDVIIENIGGVIKDKLDLKRDVVITDVEFKDVENDVNKQPLIVSFLHKQDKDSIWKRADALEKAGIKVNRKAV